MFILFIENKEWEIGGPINVEISIFRKEGKMEENGSPKTLKFKPFCGTVYEAAPSLMEQRKEL